MLLLFTSNIVKRYQADAFLALAYPRKHVMKFRYDKGLIDPDVLEWPVGNDGEVKVPKLERTALIVYCDRVGDNFEFYPLRSAEVLRVWQSGPIYHVAFCLTDYVDY